MFYVHKKINEDDDDDFFDGDDEEKKSQKSNEGDRMSRKGSVARLTKVLTKIMHEDKIKLNKKDMKYLIDKNFVDWEGYVLNKLGLSF